MLEQAQGLVQNSQLKEGAAHARRAEPSASATDTAGLRADGRATPPD
jgi:hypothetical protein